MLLKYDVKSDMFLFYVFIYLGERFYNSGTHLQGDASKEQENI
jgi:hypothetical protein